MTLKKVTSLDDGRQVLDIETSVTRRAQIVIPVNGDPEEVAAAIDHHVKDRYSPQEVKEQRRKGGNA